MTARRSGQSLIEFCLMLQIAVVTISAALWVSAECLVPYLLRLDTYDLARAHLYGNDLQLCAPSSLWPRALLAVEMRCLDIPKRYEARASLLWNGKSYRVAELSYGLWSGP